MRITRALIKGYSYEAPVVLSPECKEELRWLRDHLTSWNRKGIISPAADMVITMYADNRGWGAT